MSLCNSVISKSVVVYAACYVKLNRFHKYGAGVIVTWIIELCSTFFTLKEFNVQTAGTGS